MRCDDDVKECKSEVVPVRVSLFDRVLQGGGFGEASLWPFRHPWHKSCKHPILNLLLVTSCVSSFHSGTKAKACEPFHCAHYRRLPWRNIEELLKSTPASHWTFYVQHQTVAPSDMCQTSGDFSFSSVNLYGFHFQDCLLSKYGVHLVVSYVTGLDTLLMCGFLLQC